MRRRRGCRGRSDPASDPTPSLSDAVAEGLIIASAAVRLAVKNRILVDTLTGGVDFDVERFVPTARSAVLAMAAEAQAEADWVERARRRARRRISPSGGTHDYRYRDADNLALRRRQAERVAEGLRRRAADEGVLRQTVEAARQAAWDDVARAIDMTLRMESAPRDLGSDYQTTRPDRIRELVAIDLRRLAERRGAGDATHSR